MKQSIYLSRCNMLTHLVITLACFLCFYNSLQNGLVHDDKFAIETNPDVLGETSITDVFFNDFWGRSLTSPKSHKSFRPLCTLTFRLNYLFHGLYPFGYHLLNVFLHVIASNYFFYLLREEIFKERLSSFLAAIIFSTHPVHVEAVTGVVGRADILSCILFLLTFRSYIKVLKNDGFFCKELIWVLLLGSGTLFVKEHSVMVFAVCVAFDIFKNKDLILSKLLPHQICQREKKNDNEKKLAANHSNFTKRVTLVVLWTVALLQLRLYLMGYTLPKFKEEDNQASFSPHLKTRVLTYLYLISFNAQILLSPYVLCYDWQVGSISLVETFSDIRNLGTFACFVVLFVLSTGLVKNILKRKVNETDVQVLVGLLFLVVPFLPASNFFMRVGFTVAERILYIPSLGFCILVAIGFSKLRAIINQKLPLYFLFSVMIVLFTWKTVQYNRVWYSRETLFRSGIEILPNNAKVHYNYANFLKDTKKTMEAIHHYQQAVSLYPIHSSSHNNLGTLLAGVGKLEAAEHHFREAIKYTPGHYNAMLNIAGVLSKKNNFVEAEQWLNKCLSLKPELFEAQKLLAHVLSKNSQKEKAMELYQTLIDTNKNDDELVNNYALFLQENGHHDRSLGLFTSLLSKDPKNHNYLTSLANVYKENKQQQMARQLYERAIAYHPKVAELYHKLAVFHFHRMEISEASNVYARMVDNASPTDEHWKSYAIVLFKSKKYKQAFDILEKLLSKNERNLNVHYALIILVMETDDTAKANKVIERALNIFPNDIELLLQKANLKRNEKHYEDAIKIYSVILARNTKHFDSLLNLGTVYHVLKDYKQADRYYSLAYQVNPSNGILKQNIQKLKRIMDKQGKSS